MDRKVAIRIAVKAMNDTMGPNGLVSSYLVFECIPRFPAIESSFPDQESCMYAISRARREMATIVSELRIRKALSLRIPRNADLLIEAEDKVSVFRETDNKYVGPYPVIRVDGMQVFVISKD